MDAGEILAILSGVAMGLRGVVGRNTEVVVHNLLDPDHSVVTIVNGHVSGRTKSESILAGPKNDIALSTVISDSDRNSADPITIVSGYATYSKDGRALSSSSVLFRDSSKKLVAAFCLNTDVDKNKQTLQVITDALFPVDASTPETAPPDGETTIDSLIVEIINEAINSAGAPPERLKKAEKMAAVAVMRSRGLFLIKGSVERVARSLGTTKFTIYNYLEELGDEGEPKAE